MFPGFGDVAKIDSDVEDGIVDSEIGRSTSDLEQQGSESMTSILVWNRCLMGEMRLKVLLKLLGLIHKKNC